MPDVFSDPPVLRTERLVLRQITESDGEGLFGIFADDQVTEFYAWDRFTDVGQGHELAARTAGKFRQREAIRWGLVLARDYWRRGLMSEAVAAVLRFGFEQMALHRVEATVLTGNTASAALQSRLLHQLVQIRDGPITGDDNLVQRWHEVEEAVVLVMWSRID